MDSNATISNTLFESAQEISDNGERVSHLNQDCNYYAHLSIYDFAAQFCKDAVVLDAGSGSGYGAAYLADAGARHVWGIDASTKAIEFSRYHFQKPNLTFQDMDLGQIQGFSPQQFDFIYSSNTLEHVPNVLGFLRTAWSLLKPTGTLLIAIPPITDDRLLYLNLINPYHINLWTPRQWVHGLGLFFGEIEPVLHGVEAVGADFKPEHFAPDAKVTEKSFVFAPGTVGDMYRQFTLTAIFVARKPLPEHQIPAPDAPFAYVEKSFTRPEGYIDPALRRRLKKYFDMPSPPYVVSAETAKDKFSLKKIVRRILTFVGIKPRS